MVSSERDLSARRAVSVAVCIPAFGDPEGLGHTLASIRGADHPQSLLRIIVAVDGPDPATEKAAVGGGADEVVVLPKNRGSYAARNAAIDAVGDDAELVLFTDAGAIVDGGWIGAHIDALQAAPRSGGAVLFELSDPPRPAEVVDANRHLDQQHYVEHLGFAATVNLAVRRPILDAVRFDDTLRSGGDFEFGRRCEEAGLAIAWTPQAVVRHPARATARELLRKIDRVALGARSQQTAGRPAIARRRDRRPLAAASRAYGHEPGARWMAEAWLLDRACSVAYARRVPSVVVPAIRRRVRVRTSR